MTDQAIQSPATSGEAAAAGWFLPAAAINDLQRKSVSALIAHARRAYWTNAIVRKDGEETTYEADWLKHMTPVAAYPAAPVGQDAPAQEPVAEMVAIDDGLGTVFLEFIGERPPAGTKLYATPPAAAAPVPLAGQAWQPIATAPKDGAHILLGYFPEGGGASQEVAFWHGIRQMWCGRVLLNAEGYFSPTHWKPLDAPPQQEAPQGGK